MFWDVLDRASPENLAELLQRDYLDRGTAGLRDFIPYRIRSAAELAEMVERKRDRYEAARESSLSILSAERAIRAPFYALEYLYPEAVFPDVYFVIGRLNSGGTTSDHGLLIGAEMYTDAEALPHIVAHELIHFQQPSGSDGGNTLLAASIREGSADFLAELISGKHINDEAHAYGRAHERALWTEFQERMFEDDLSGWLYGDPPGERPADLGYFIGYRITEAYYKRAADKKRAIREIINVRDFEDFLAKSGYQP